MTKPKQMKFDWDDYTQALQIYLNEHGDTVVPQGYKIDMTGMKLGKWVQNQRQNKRTNKLSKERIKELNDLGFCWNCIISVAGKGGGGKTKKKKTPAKKRKKKKKEEESEEEEEEEEEQIDEDPGPGEDEGEGSRDEEYKVEFGNIPVEGYEDDDDEPIAKLKEKRAKEPASKKRKT